MISNVASPEYSTRFVLVLAMAVTVETGDHRIGFLEGAILNTTNQKMPHEMQAYRIGGI